MHRYQDWLAQSKRDLQRAEIDLQYEFWEWACFTAQHAAEKACLAFLMRFGVTAWGYAITAMIQNFQGTPVPDALVQHARLLDAYYLPTRYPSRYDGGKPAEFFNEGKAREAVSAAKEIVRFCEENLPGEG